MEIRSLEQVEKEIEETKLALQDVHGTETEVYARIVGYYRAVKHWNNGKKDEFYQRKMFTIEDSKKHEITKITESKPAEKAAPQKTETQPVMNSNVVSYEIYTRKTCPNCPPVKEFMNSVEIPGRSVDVDTPEGLAEAAKKGIFATPTVIFFNEAGVETARCHNVEELEAVMETVSVNA